MKKLAAVILALVMLMALSAPALGLPVPAQRMEYKSIQAGTYDTLSIPSNTTYCIDGEVTVTKTLKFDSNSALHIGTGGYIKGEGVLLSGNCTLPNKIQFNAGGRLDLTLSDEFYKNPAKRLTMLLDNGKVTGYVVAGNRVYYPGNAAGFILSGGSLWIIMALAAAALAAVAVIVIRKRKHGPAAGA